MQSTGAEGTTFLVDQVSGIIEEAIEVTIGTNVYTISKINTWINSIVETTLTNLAKLQKAFKYIVTCVILEKIGAGLSMASSSYWDKDMDGSCTVRWENKTICVIVNVFGLSMV